MKRGHAWLLCLGIAASSLPLPTIATAQHSSYFQPVERAFLESHVDVQLHYSRASFAPLEMDLLYLSVEGQYVLWDRLEIGLGLPFLTHTRMDLGAGPRATGPHMGDAALNLKVKFIGANWFAYSMYLNTRLPTNSWSGAEGRNHVVVLTGMALSFLLGDRGVGGGLSCQAGTWTNALFGFDGYVSYRLLPWLDLTAALQFAISPVADNTITVLAFTPGLVLRPNKKFHVGVASRVAVTDDARLFYGGRWSLQLHFGVRL